VIFQMSLSFKAWYLLLAHTPLLHKHITGVFNQTPCTRVVFTKSSLPSRRKKNSPPLQVRNKDVREQGFYSASHKSIPFLNDMKFASYIC